MTRRLNENQRADLVRYANRLVQGGVSRRRMNTLLRAYSLEKFGVASGIGTTTHSELFHRRVEAVKRRERGYRREEKVKFVSPTQRKRKHYNKLIDWHFLPEEVGILVSGLKTLSYPEVKKMRSERAYLFNRFLRLAVARGYPKDELPGLWRKYVNGWYYSRVAGRTLRRKMRRGEPVLPHLLWRWYNAVKAQLPAKQQTESPKAHRRKRQDFVTKDKITKSGRIANLQAQIERTKSPSMRAWLQGLIEKERMR